MKLRIGFLAFLFLAAIHGSPAQTFSVLHHFGAANVTGFHPQGPLPLPVMALCMALPNMATMDARAARKNFFGEGSNHRLAECCAALSRKFSGDDCPSAKVGHNRVRVSVSRIVAQGVSPGRPGASRAIFSDDSF
jgi:hypothetical protein